MNTKKLTRRESQVDSTGVYAAKGQNPTSNARDMVVCGQCVVGACNRHRRSAGGLRGEVHSGNCGLGLPRVPLFGPDEQRQHEADDAHDEGAQEGSPETGNVKAQSQPI
jgi:hypothetical protein